MSWPPGRDQVSDNRPENDRTAADGTGCLTSAGAARAAGRTLSGSAWGTRANPSHLYAGDGMSSRGHRRVVRRAGSRRSTSRLRAASPAAAASPPGALSEVLTAARHTGHRADPRKREPPVDYVTLNVEMCSWVGLELRRSAGHHPGRGPHRFRLAW